MLALQTYFWPLVAKQRRGNRLGAALMIVIGVIGIAWALGESDRDRAMTRMLVMCAFGLVAALVALVISFVPHRGLAALANPERIVWVFGVNRRGHVNAVMIGTDDGRLHRLPLQLKSIKEGFSQEGIERIRAAAPHATYGHSEQYRLAFKQNPASLRRALQATEMPHVASRQRISA